MFSILFINSEIHILRKKGTPAPKWTARPITNEEFAQFARCTVRAIEIAVGDLVARKVIERKKTAKGYVYALPFASWAGLPDRPSKVVTLGEAESADEETEDEATRPRGEVKAVFAKPQKVRAGGRTRPKELPTAAGKLQFEAETEMEFDARMCDGVLTIRAKGEQRSGSTKGEQKRNVFRVDSTEVPPNQRLSNFHLFEQAWLNQGINASPEDWAAARATWSQLDTAEQLSATKGVTDRFERGEYDDPTFIPLPQNYLRKKLWMRPVRGRKTVQKATVFRDEEGARALMANLRRIGGKK